MPRKLRPRTEIAVAASPLFKLALEVRIMIYELLLIQEGGMFIPSDLFARREYRRIGFKPYQCEICGLVFLSNYGCTQHITNRHPGQINFTGTNPLKVLLPGMSISILQTCRIIRLEASPILYSKNSFHFSDPTTASNFRWGTDCVQAGAAQEIGIKFGSNHYKQVTPWVEYLTRRTLSLGQDFPHLRRITFNLDTWIGQESSAKLSSLSQGLRKRSQALDWVLVLMLNNAEVLDCFESLVDKKDEFENVEKEVQRYVWADKIRTRWKNALLWWGSPGEAVPRKYRLIGDQPQ